VHSSHCGVCIVCGTGTLNEKEITRALDLWNIPIDQSKLRDLIAACDGDGDGEVDYKEFVDVLARDTVAPAAMGKRDMQSKEAMGVNSQADLAVQLGRSTKGGRATSVQPVYLRAGDHAAPTTMPAHRAPPVFAPAAARPNTPQHAAVIDKQNHHAGGASRPASASSTSSLARSHSYSADRLGRSTTRMSVNRDAGSLNADAMLARARAAPPAAPPTPPMQSAVVGEAQRAKLKSSAFVRGAADALNSRFSDMFKAFQYVDLDRSGTTTAHTVATFSTALVCTLPTVACALCVVQARSTRRRSRAPSTCGTSPSTSRSCAI
jgi:hypothetical protein